MLLCEVSLFVVSLCDVFFALGTCCLLYLNKDVTFSIFAFSLDILHFHFTIVGKNEKTKKRSNFFTLKGTRFDVFRFLRNEDFCIGHPNVNPLHMLFTTAVLNFKPGPVTGSFRLISRPGSC